MQAVAFCDRLSELTGKKVTLPTEAQWEWAARAGTASDMWYGNRDVDFSKHANLSDLSHQKGCARRSAPQYFNYVENVNDRHAATAPVHSYQQNAWGLYDMIGNAEEWTASVDEEDAYIVKGGSWFDMPKDATSAVRWAYQESVRLPDLGFRIIVED